MSVLKCQLHTWIIISQKITMKWVIFAINQCGLSKFTILHLPSGLGSLSMEIVAKQAPYLFSNIRSIPVIAEKNSPIVHQL